MNGFGDAAGIDTLCAELTAAGGVEVVHSLADMRDPEQIEKMVKEAAERCGGLDILVNNAGIQFVSPIESFPVEKWNDIIAINLSSAFHTMRTALPVMVEAGWGRVVNIASTHALVASPFKCAYVAAKHGIAGLTKTTALEMAEKGVTINAVAPGYVETPLVSGQITDTARARGITEEEVVRDVMLLAQRPEWSKAIVLIDIGPGISPVGYAQILSSVGRQREVKNWQEAAEQCRQTYSLALPDMPLEFWRAFVHRSYRETADGKLELDMDPNIGEATRKGVKTVRLMARLRKLGILRRVGGVFIDPWDSFRAVSVPCLVLRGEISDILSQEIVDRMVAVKPDLVRVTIPNRGHSPLIDGSASLMAIDEFLQPLLRHNMVTIGYSGVQLSCTDSLNGASVCAN